VRQAAAELAGAGERNAPDAGVLALPHTDWLYHHLRVTGEPGAVAALRVAAAGAGVIPWAPDLGPAAEDWFYLLAVPPAPQRRSLSLEGARILAGQLRDAAEARQRLVADRAAASQACPLDLHRLLLVPARLLRLGSDAAETRAWLWAHWGTTQALRGAGGRCGPRAAPPRDSLTLDTGGWASGRPTGRRGGPSSSSAPAGPRSGSRSGRFMMIPEEDLGCGQSALLFLVQPVLAPVAGGDPRWSSDVVRY
jgi:hypothetical protein